MKQHAVQIVESHMPSSKEKSAMEIALQAVDAKSQLMDIASYIKTHYDKAYPGSGKATEGVYHAMCGTHFASAHFASLALRTHTQVCAAVHKDHARLLALCKRLTRAMKACGEHACWQRNVSVHC